MSLAVPKQRTKLVEKINARVLTSIDSFRAIEEKEEKKRDQIRLKDAKQES